MPRPPYLRAGMPGAASHAPARRKFRRTLAFVSIGGHSAGRAMPALHSSRRAHEKRLFTATAAAATGRRDRFTNPKSAACATSTRGSPRKKAGLGYL